MYIHQIFYYLLKYTSSSLIIIFITNIFLFNFLNFLINKKLIYERLDKASKTCCESSCKKLFNITVLF